MIEHLHLQTINIIDFIIANTHLFLAIGSLLLCSVVSRIAKYKRRSNSRPGDWKAVTFSYPDISPCLTSIHDLTPIKYRPFKPVYYVTMGIRSMPWDEWIEIDQQFPAYHAIRQRRVETKGEDVIALAPETRYVRSAYHAAVELVHEMAEYLHKRYPSAYQVVRNAKRGCIQTLSIVAPGAPSVAYELPPPLRNSTQGLALRSVSKEEALKALNIIALIAQDDWALMVEGADGRYYLQGGALCITGSWRLRDKIGKPLDEFHIQSGVPHYKEKLDRGMSKFFKRLPVDKPVVRNNYGFQIVPPSPPAPDNVDPEELAWSTTTYGPEDEHPSPECPTTATPENLRLRTERQTLRRLPLSGAVVFGIRTYMSKLEDLAAERGVAQRLASAVRSWSDDVAEYKGKRRYGDVLLRYLDERVEEEEWEGNGEADTVYPF